MKRKFFKSKSKLTIPEKKFNRWLSGDPHNSNYGGGYGSSLDHIDTAGLDVVDELTLQGFKTPQSSKPNRVILKNMPAANILKPQSQIEEKDLAFEFEDDA